MGVEITKSERSIEPKIKTYPRLMLEIDTGKIALVDGALNAVFVYSPEASGGRPLLITSFNIRDEIKNHWIDFDGELRMKNND